MISWSTSTTSGTGITALVKEHSAAISIRWSVNKSDVKSFNVLSKLGDGMGMLGQNSVFQRQTSSSGPKFRISENNLSVSVSNSIFQGQYGNS